MQLHRSLVSLIIAIVVLILVSQSVGLVHEGQTGVRLRAGDVIATGLKPGLHFRLPFFGRIADLNDHWITLDSDTQNGGRVKLASSDGKTLETGYAAVWHVSDAAAFCGVTGCDESAGAQRINDALMPLLKQVFSTRTAAELQAGNDSISLRDIPAKLNAQLHDLGVAVQAVHLTALTLPQDQLNGVYQQMRAAQSDQATQIRAQGVSSADAIKAKADKQKDAILARAEIQAQTIHGQAEAEAAAIYARAYNEDPEFFRFYRSLEAYKRTIKNSNSVIVLGPDSGFLKYFDGLKTPPAEKRH
ncbi:MAG: SPFH domain-containing protein [Gammaproteobacteria bacterium]